MLFFEKCVAVFDMFVVSMKPTAKKVFISAVIIMVIFIAVIFSGNRAKSELVLQPDTASAIAVNNEQRQDYLKSFGWEVSDEPVEIVEVVIPEKFGEVYSRYNKLQREQGFDLEKYKGKLVKRYTYAVNNYPNEPEYVRANMLVINGQIIGGDICSLKLDGFMHGFKKQE